jgi:type II secretion system protein J
MKRARSFPCRPPSADSAFTLLEVILALALGALAIVAAQSAFGSAVRLRLQAQERIDADLATHRALQIVREDLAGLLPRGGRFSGELQTAAGSEIPPPAGALTIGPDFVCTSGRVDAWSPFGDVQRVSYLLIPNEGTSRDLFTLVRSVSRNLLPMTEAEAETQILLEDVSAALFEFHDGSGWLTDWDSAAAQAMPVAIRLTLERRGRDNAASADPVTLVVPIAVGDPNR